MKRIVQAVLISTAVLSFSAMAANYGPVSSKNPGYVVDSSGNIIKSARTGQCVRLGRQWSSSNADKGCMSTLQATSK